MKIQSLPIWHNTTLCIFSPEFPQILPTQMATEWQWSRRQTALSGLFRRGKGIKCRLLDPPVWILAPIQQLRALVPHSRTSSPVPSTVRFGIKRGYTFETRTPHVSSTDLVYIFNIMYELWEHLVFCKFGQIQLHCLFQTCPLTC